MRIARDLFERRGLGAAATGRQPAHAGQDRVALGEVVGDRQVVQGRQPARAVPGGRR